MTRYERFMVGFMVLAPVLVTAYFIAAAMLGKLPS